MIKLGSNSIGKIYLGSNSIGKAYLGSNLVFQKGGSGPTPPTPTPILPAGYTELQYVATDSRAFIDTGIAGATDLDIVVKFSMNNWVEYAYIYGNHNDADHRCNRAMLNNSNHKDELIVAGGLNRTQRVAGMSYNNVQHTLSVNSTRAILDGVTTSVASDSYTNNTDNIVLGNSNATAPNERDAGLRIYSFEIKKSGTSILNYIPAQRDSDDAVGFYDISNEVFVKSLTGTEFSAGPVA